MFGEFVGNSLTKFALEIDDFANEFPSKVVYEIPTEIRTS